VCKEFVISNNVCFVLNIQLVGARPKATVKSPVGARDLRPVQPPRTLSARFG
jgi:hypothetical protein